MRLAQRLIVASLVWRSVDALRDQGINIAQIQPAAMLSMNGNASSQVFLCDNYCVDCSSGISWYVRRKQSASSKVAKTLALAGAAASISGIGALFMGGAIVFGVGSTLLVGGGAISVVHLMSSRKERACPSISFEQKLQANAGMMKGLSVTAKDLLNKIRGLTPEESTFSLDDVNFQELLLKVKGPDGELLIHGDRSDMNDDARLKSVMACNMMTFDTREWAEEIAKHGFAGQGHGETDLVSQCGAWLCAGGTVSGITKPGLFGKCGGRTNIMANLNPFG